MVIVIIVGLSGVDSDKRLELEREHASLIIFRLLDTHLETLARRRLVLLKADHYGVMDHKKWNNEIKNFFDKVASPHLTRAEAMAVTAFKNSKPLFQEIIDSKVRIKSTEIERCIALSCDFTPEQFELWCSNALALNGWKSSTTKATGDQGADVIAEKNGLRVVFQCKLYSSAVGNKAVQEAFAAQRHYVARVAAVVTNAEYTKSARDLANSTGVLLLHHSELTRFDDLLGESYSEMRLPKLNYGNDGDTK